RRCEDGVADVDVVAAGGGDRRPVERWRIRGDGGGVGRGDERRRIRRAADRGDGERLERRVGAAGGAEVRERANAPLVIAGRKNGAVATIGRRSRNGAVS